MIVPSWLCSEGATAADNTLSPVESRGLPETNVGMDSRTGGLLTSALDGGGPMFHIKKGKLTSRMRSHVLHLPLPAVDMIPLGLQLTHYPY